MPQIFAPNLDPRYYAQPATFRCTIGAAAITAFPASATIGGVQASGALTFGGALPADASTVTINSVVITFKVPATSPGRGFSLRNSLLVSTVLSANGSPIPFQSVGPYGLECQVGTTVGETVANLVALLRSYPDENLQRLNFRMSAGNVLTIVSAVTGTGANSFTLAASSSPASGVTVSGSTLSGGVAPTAGYAVLVEPQPQPVEIQTVAGLCRAAQTAGSMTLFKSDGVNLTKSAAATFAAGIATNFGTTQENSPIPFASVAAATPLLVPPWTGVYAYGGTTQVIDIETGAGGVY